MFRAKKFLGQHFLTDENIARKIIGYLNPEVPRILEIGPGKGILSKYLLQNQAFDPWFIEIDPEAINYLATTYPPIRDRLIQEDFLRYNPLQLLQIHSQQHCHCERSEATIAIQLLGNFPYNISSQILFRVLEYRQVISDITGMFQKEVALRIASPPGSKEYGILSVLIQAFYQVTVLFTVNETVFEPPPKVKSAVVRFRRNETDALPCSEQLWIKVVKTAFNQRRKTVRNALKRPGIPLPASWKDPLFDRRAEQLSVQDFIRLTSLLQGNSTENI